jgi:hypothetical protein
LCRKIDSQPLRLPCGDLSSLPDYWAYWPARVARRRQAGRFGRREALIYFLFYDSGPTLVRFGVTVGAAYGV